MPPIPTDPLYDAKGRVRPTVKVLGFVAAYLGLIFLVMPLLQAAGLLRHLHLGSTSATWLDAGFVALATVLCLALERQAPWRVGLVLNGRWFLECLAGTVGGALIMGLTALLVLGAGGFHWVRNPLGGAASLLSSAWLFLAVAFNEELLFRGYGFQRLVEGAGVWTGQLVFAVLFVAVHWGNPGMSGATRLWATLNIGLAGLLLGLAWIRTRNLALPIGIHLGWNWTQGALLGFGVSGTTDAPGLWTPVFHHRPEWLTGGAFGLEASLPCAVVCAAAILLLARWKGRTSPA